MSTEVKITISATVKRQDPITQTFVLAEGKPLKLNPKILEDIMSLEISLSKELKDVGTNEAPTATEIRQSTATS